MEMRRVLSLIVATGIAIFVIIGLINFDLFVSIWAKSASCGCACRLRRHYSKNLVSFLDRIQ